MSTHNRSMYDINFCAARDEGDGFPRQEPIYLRPRGPTARLSSPTTKNRQVNFISSTSGDDMEEGLLEQGRRKEVDASSSGSFMVVNKSSAATVKTDCNRIQDDEYDSPDDEGEAWEKNIMFINKAKRNSRAVFQSERTSQLILGLDQRAKFVHFRAYSDAEMN